MMDNSNNNQKTPNENAADAGMEQILKSLPPDLAKLALQGVPNSPSAESSRTADANANNNKGNKNIPVANLNVDNHSSNQVEALIDDDSLDSALENMQDDVTSMFSDKLDEEIYQDLTQEVSLKDEDTVVNTVVASSIKFQKKKKLDWVRLVVYLVGTVIIGIMCFISMKMNANLSNVNYVDPVIPVPPKRIDDEHQRIIDKIEKPIERYNYLVNKAMNYDAIKYLAKIIQEKGKNRGAIVKIINSLPKGNDKNILNALRRVDREYEHKEPIILSLLASRELDPEKKASVLKNIVAINANDTNAGTQLIKYHYNLNELNEALKMCENVISYNINAPLEVFQNKAELLVLLGKEKKAKVFFERILTTRENIDREEQLISLLNIFMLAKKSNYVDKYLKELNKVSDKKQLKRYFDLYRNAVFSTIKRDAFFKNNRDWDLYSKPFFIIALMENNDFLTLATMPNSKNEFPAMWNIYSNWKLHTIFWQDNAFLIAQGKVHRDKVEVLFSKLILKQITIKNYMKKQKEISLPLLGKYLFFAAEYYFNINDIENAKKCYKQSLTAPGNIYRSVVIARLKKLKNKEVLSHK